MKLAKADLGSLLYVARNMRQADREEIFATRWTDSPDELAAEAFSQRGEFRFVAGDDAGVPIAAIGAVPAWDGMWSAWMFGTDRFGEIGRHLTRWVRRAMIPAVVEAGAHRVEARSMATHTDAHRWMERLGAKPEFVLRQYGREKQDFILFAWEF